MFKASGTNPYDDIVAKTTDENLTSENWELILNLCDKVQEEGEEGAGNVIAALLKRFTHRNSNVQLYALSLTEALSKNCGKNLHREMASRAFTQGLERLITDRNTHTKVQRRALGLMVLWTEEFKSDPSLSLMEESYHGLTAKNYKFVPEDEPPPPAVDDEARRREEEELQRALEMSVLDKGGRAQWTSQYTPTGENLGAGSSATAGPSGSVGSSSSRPGYVAAPARQPIPSQAHSYAPPINTAYSPQPTSPPPAPAPAAQVPLSPNTASPIVTRVRALYTFEPTEPGELGFEKGEVIKVVDRGYKDWWRGQLRGRTGIFPVNYVEPLPEPTAAELAREAEQEAQVFSQAANIDKLLTMLHDIDASKDNLADNEEIQELYRQSMAVRPKIVKLIDKYSQKRADLVSMNESFVKARTIFDGMMEESLAKHSAAWDVGRPSFQQPRPLSVVPQDYRGPTPGQNFGWNPQGYEQHGYGGYPSGPTAPNGYEQQQPPQQPPYPGGQQPVHAPEGSQYGQQPQVYPPQGYPPQQQQQYVGQTSYPQVQPQAQPPPQTQGSPQPVPVQQSQQSQVQSQPQAITQPQVQQQAAAQSPPQGPPFVFDPNATYPDPNVQAWAQYYANGGKDLTGAVYFISVPGVTDTQEQPGLPVAPEPQSQVSVGVPSSPTGQSEPQSGGGYLPYPGDAPSAQAAPSIAGIQQPYLQHHSSTGSLAQQPQQVQYSSLSRQSSYVPQSGAVPMSPTAGTLPQPPYGNAPQSPTGDMPNPHAQYQSAYHQMQNQFSGMGVSGGSQQEQSPQGVHAA